MPAVGAHVSLRGREGVVSGASLGTMKRRGDEFVSCGAWIEVMLDDGRDADHTRPRGAAGTSWGSSVTEGPFTGYRRPHVQVSCAASRACPSAGTPDRQPTHDRRDRDQLRG